MFAGSMNAASQALRAAHGCGASLFKAVGVALPPRFASRPTSDEGTDG